MRNMNCIGIIPARAGSKGLPGKHLKMLSGIPLISWTIRQAFSSSQLDSFYVSTDCPDVVKLAIKEGVPKDRIINRPKYLASDDSLIIDALSHSIKYISSIDRRPDLIALLEPTSPLRNPLDINNALLRLIQNSSKYDSLISLGPFRNHPQLAKQLNGDTYTDFIDLNYKISSNRQTYTPLFFPFGVIYISKTDVLLEEKSFYTKRSTFFLLEEWQCFEIDDILDFYCVEAIASKYNHCIPL